jgi:hypothetical protein
VALVTVAGGLVVGAWFGRARWLIPIGVVLSLMLGVSTAAGHFEKQHVEDIDLTPRSVSELRNAYVVDVGSVRLDLSHIDFTDTDVDMNVAVNTAGDVVVILPPNVDADVFVDVKLGNATVFGRDLGGVGRHDTISDAGADGTGGGRIHLRATVGVGDLEVHR